MKVIIISDADAKYGAPRAMMEMAMTLKKKYDIEPIVLTCEKSVINDQCDENGIENYVTYHRSFMYAREKLSMKYCFKNVLRYIRYKICAVLSMKLVVQYVNFRDIELIHSNSSRLDFGMELSVKYHIPHILHIREEWGHGSFRKNYIDYINSHTTRCIAISDNVYRAWNSSGIVSDKLTRIYDGIELDDIEVKSDVPNDIKLKLVCVGSLLDRKGQADIIKSLTVLPDGIKKNVYLDLIGDGKNYTKLVNLKKKLKCENVSFLGYREDVRKILKNYDCGIIASTHEGFGRTTVEYMGAGLCVIASNTGANVEIVDDNINGLLYEYGNIEDLAQKIKFVYKETKRRIEMGQNGRRKVYANFSKEINADNIYQLYKKIIAQKRQGSRLVE